MSKFKRLVEARMAKGENWATAARHVRAKRAGSTAAQAEYELVKSADGYVPYFRGRSLLEGSSRTADTERQLAQKRIDGHRAEREGGREALARVGGDPRKLDGEDLRAAAIDSDAARMVEQQRADAVTQLRLVAARVCGVGSALGHEDVNILPCLTDTSTIGLIHTLYGTAWDTGVVAHDGVHELELRHRVYEEVSDAERRKHPEMPPGWRVIEPPFYRGYGGVDFADVPESEFRAETWIRPRFVAGGLMMEHGHPAKYEGGRWPGVYDGTYLDSAAASKETQWPNGVPDWMASVHGSVTVSWALLGEIAPLGHPLPRQSQKAETARIERAYGAALDSVRERLQAAAEGCRRYAAWASQSQRSGDVAKVLQVRRILSEIAEAPSWPDVNWKAVRSAIETIEHLHPDALMPATVDPNLCTISALRYGVDAVQEARRCLDAGCPWKAACVLGSDGFADSSFLAFLGRARADAYSDWRSAAHSSASLLGTELTLVRQELFVRALELEPLRGFLRTIDLVLSYRMKRKWQDEEL